MIAVLQAGPQYTAVLALVLAAIASPVTAIVTFLIGRAVKKQDWNRQDEVAERVAWAAKLLEENTSKVNGKLNSLEDGQKQIHILVNSNLTAQMDARRSSLVRELAVLRELAAIKTKSDNKPMPETFEAIKTAKESLNELEAQLKDRLAATKKGKMEVKEPV